MQAVLAIAIGILTGSGVYLLLRPRSFQVIMGLTLLSYAVNLFIFSMGRLKVDSEPILMNGITSTMANLCWSRCCYLICSTPPKARNAARRASSGEYPRRR